MRLDHRGLRVELCQLAQVGLDGVERARFRAARRRVNEDRHVVSVQQRVGEIEAAYAEIDHAHFIRLRAAG